jgi:two-component system cell cycle response regulator CpdR
LITDLLNNGNWLLTIRLDSLKILVAEDEPEVLRYYKVLLEDLGYEVVAAKNGQECIDLYRNIAGPNSGFDLVILDHKIPRKTGMEVAKEIAAMAPAQKLLMVTAYAGVLDLRQKPENMIIMPKPFHPDELISTIRKLTNKVLTYT